MMGVIRRIFDYNRRYGWRYAVRRAYRRFGLKYIWGRRSYPYFLPEAERRKQREEMLAFTASPLISIIVPLFHTSEKYLEEMLASVFGQTYDGWELCLADASEDNHLGEVVKRYQEKAGQRAGADGQQRKGRLQYLHIGKNAGIADNSNAAAKMASGEYIALLDHDDLLHPAALYEVVRAICQEGADFVYTDELSFVRKPSLVQSVHLKSDFQWEHIRSNNYICHFSVFSRELFWRVGGFRKEYDGAQDYDLFFRMAEQCQKIFHIPKVLYYWRLHEGSCAAGMEAKPYVAAAGRRAVEQHLRRVGIAAAVEETELGTFYRVSYSVPEESRVLLFAEDEETAGWLQESLQGCSYKLEVCCGKEGDVTGRGQAVYDSYVVFVRSGYRPVHGGYAWLTELLGCLQWQENRLAGALVYNRKGKVEHAGFYRDRRNPQKVYSRYQGAPKAENGYMNHLRFTRAVDYLYGAVLAMGWEEYQQIIQERAGEVWGKRFEKEAWFSLCRKVKEQGKYSVLAVQEPWTE